MPVISSFPYVINSAGYYTINPGVYYVTGDAIIINADDVIIDGTGSCIVRYQNVSNSNKGVYWNNRTNIVVQNCNVRNFFYGIHGDLNVSVNTATIRNNIIENSTFRGIRIYSNRASIVDNIIRQTTGSTVYPNAYCFGIEVDGHADIARNVVQDTYGVGTGEGVGISCTEYGTAMVIRNNLIHNEILTPTHTYGIWCGGTNTTSLLVKDNTMINFAYGMAASSPVHGGYMGNSTLSCTVKYDIAGSNFADMGNNI